MEKMKKFITIIISFNIISLGYLFASSDSKKEEMIKRCYSDHLHRNTGCMIMMYTQEYHSFPADISTLFKWSGGTDGVAYIFSRCPAVCDHVELFGAKDKIDSWMDYIYVYWPDFKNIPPDYPMMYDRRLSNHGNGICILFTDGHGEWDEGASKLQKFAKDHPEIKIPMPGDLKTK